MIAVTPAALTGTPVTMDARCAMFMVSLIDRRTGATHRVNGAPLRLFSADPEATAGALLRNRDPRHWETRVARLHSGGVQ
ncbi:hypothetical protein [Ruixingdingia sedimenti]|uniref:Uncharacterized protein n=1 Tax=Ruixingdingia sedimenti TaxID=3073604 RepID=A0ABU1F2T5_9RHOB|nr:hypothetical protein [Xinfangfangia sp. LG-4]MDR5651175.1 hypothetical protein [Xinfangfangia sp. LG-4]